MLKVVHEESEPNATSGSVVGSSVLDEIVRDGARQMLAAALQAEVAAYVAAHAGEIDERGRRLVVRNGCHAEREVTTVAGAVPVRQPRVNDKRTDPATNERMRFSSTILPAWERKSPQVSEVLPLLYLHGLSTSDFAPALEQFLGTRACPQTAADPVLRPARSAPRARPGVPEGTPSCYHAAYRPPRRLVRMKRGDAMARRPVLTALTAAVLLASAALASAAQEATPAAPPEPGFVALFDGTAASFAAWRVVGADGFDLVDGAIVARAGDDLGLLYYAPRTFGDFVLRLAFRIAQPEDNSGVFVRFRDPTQPAPAPDPATPGAAAALPNRGMYAANGAWVAIDTGYEVQIDEAALGNPMDPGDDGQDRFRTGALYDVPVGTGQGEQAYRRGPAVEPGAWHELEIEVVGDAYTVRLDGQQTTTFVNPDPFRGRSPSQDPASGYVGLQSHPFTAGHVDFRNIRVRELPTAGTPPGTPEVGTPAA